MTGLKKKLKGKTMFNIFKKKPNRVELFSPTDGEIIPLEAVSDEVFSSKAMGEGFAIKPVSNEIFSPIIGEVISVFPTKHALAVKTSQGLEVLLHIGIDTVELQGKPFEIFVKPGEKVTNETKLATVDLSYLEKHEKPSDIMIILTNLNDLKGQLVDMQYGDQKRSTGVGYINF